MNQHLSRDEFDALEEVSKQPKVVKAPAKYSACVARNAKRLVGIKLMQFRKDGSYVLTEKGSEALFIKKCLAGLHAVAANTGVTLDAPVATFLGRKGYITAESGGQFLLTARGQECLEDIAKNP